MDLDAMTSVEVFSLFRREVSSTVGKAAADELYRRIDVAESTIVEQADKADRARTACQTIIAAIGSIGPENVEGAAARIVAKLADTERRAEAGERMHDACYDDLVAAQAALDAAGIVRGVGSSYLTAAERIALLGASSDKVLALRKALDAIRVRRDPDCGSVGYNVGDGVAAALGAALDVCESLGEPRAQSVAAPPDQGASARLREAVQALLSMPKDHRTLHSGVMALRWSQLEEALAAEPATPVAGAAARIVAKLADTERRAVQAEKRREHTQQLYAERWERMRALLPQSDVREALREVLCMLAMVPESMLTGLRVDPYGTIGDALEVLGESRQPDSWRALHRMAGLPDPGDQRAVVWGYATNDGDMALTADKDTAAEWRQTFRERGLPGPFEFVLTPSACNWNKARAEIKAMKEARE